MLTLASFYDAICKSNYDTTSNIYVYVMIGVIILLVVIIIYLIQNPRIVYVPVRSNNMMYNY